MKTSQTLIIILLVVICFLSFSFIQQKSNTQYEYLSLVQIDNQIKMSFPNGQFESEKMGRDEWENNYHFSYLFRKVSGFEQQGWELIESNVSFTAETSLSYPTNYCLLRREKK